MRDRRRRRRGSRSLLSTLALVVGVSVVATAVIGGAGIGAASFDTLNIDRGHAVDVTDDETAAHALDTAGSVHVNATEPLVNVTNNLGTDVTVTVQLRDDSTQIGDLVVDGTVVGNSSSFALAAGGTRTVELQVPDDGSLSTKIVYFHVNASGGGIKVTAPDRSVPVN